MAAYEDWRRYWRTVDPSQRALGDDALNRRLFADCFNFFNCDLTRAEVAAKLEPLVFLALRREPALEPSALQAQKDAWAARYNFMSI